MLDRILLPSVRWYLKRRVNRVINEINTRLDIKIRPIQITRRQALIERLMFDEKVISAVRVHADKRKMPIAVAQQKAHKYAGEIIPAFNAYIYFRIGYWLAKKLARMVYRVRVGFFDNGKIAALDPEATVVFVMNHRSNMDYVLVSFLVAEKTTLSYAVGEWAHIWPLQTLIKLMGAFFVRRNSANPLYRCVLERYINMSTRAGVCQAVFLEGGLTRDGKMRKPKLGFINYMLRDYHLHDDRDIVFIPVGINYDRVIEDRSLLRRLDKSADKRSFWFILKTTLSFITKNILLSRKNRWRRFGYASVNFGQPISIKKYCVQNKFDFSAIKQNGRFICVENLTNTLMAEIKKVVPILPIALMAEVLLKNKKQWCSALELKQAGVQRIQTLQQQGAPIMVATNTIEKALSAALDALYGRHMVKEQNNLFQADENEVQILTYYANSIEHWPANAAAQ